MGEYKIPNFEAEAKEESMAKTFITIVSIIEDIWNSFWKHAPVVWKKLNTRMFLKKKYSPVDFIVACLIGCVIFGMGPVQIFSLVLSIAFFLAFVHEIRLKKGVLETKPLVNIGLSLFFLWWAGFLF